MLDRFFGKLSIIFWVFFVTIINRLRVCGCLYTSNTSELLGFFVLDSNTVFCFWFKYSSLKLKKITLQQQIMTSRTTKTYTTLKDFNEQTSYTQSENHKSFNTKKYQLNCIIHLVVLKNINIWFVSRLCYILVLNLYISTCEKQTVNKDKHIFNQTSKVYILHICIFYFHSVNMHINYTWMQQVFSVSNLYVWIYFLPIQRRIEGGI